MNSVTVPRIAAQSAVTSNTKNNRQVLQTHTRVMPTHTHKGKASTLGTKGNRTRRALRWPPQSQTDWAALLRI